MFVRLRAIGSRLSRAREWFPVTNLGLIVFGLAALAYWGFAVPRIDYVLRLVAVVVMVAVAVAVGAVVIGAVLVHSAVRQSAPSDPVTLEAHRGYAELFSLPTWWILPLFDVRWQWLEPAGFRVETRVLGGRRLERVETERRNQVDRIVRRLVIEDGFGLARLVLHRTQPCPLTVLPWTGALHRAPLLQSLASGDVLPHPRGAPIGDPVDMRRYAPGDPLKLAMWKVYARTRQLMVRTPERAIAPSTQVAAYLLAAVADEPPAAAARMAVESGLLGPNWTFGADGNTRAVEDVDSARRSIIESRAHRDAETGQAAGLASFVDGFGPSAHARLVVFVPGRPGPWLDRVVDVARHRPDHTSCVVVVDGIRSDDERAPSRWSRWLRRPEAPTDADEAWVTADELNDVVVSLARAGIEVTALDRTRGRALNTGRLGGAPMTARQVA